MSRCRRSGMPSPARRVISNDLLGGALTLRTSLFFATNYFTLSGRDHHCIFLEQFFELVQYTFGGGPNQSIEVGQIELMETREVPAAFSTPLLRRDWHIWSAILHAVLSTLRPAVAAI
jgi:hypothetical protein